MRVPDVDAEPARAAADVWEEPEDALWEAKRASPLSAAWLAATRLGQSWRLLLGVGLGILVAVVLIAAVPLYSSLMGNVQLQAEITGATPQERDVEFVVPSPNLTAATADQQDATVRRLGRQYLGAFTAPGATRYFSTDPVALTQAGARSFSDVTVAPLAYDYAQAGPHMRLVAGALPAAVSDPTAPIQALITPEMAADLGAKVGDSLTLAAGLTPAQSVAARVVGIWMSGRAADPFWNGHVFAPGDGPNGITYPLLLDATGIYRIVAPPRTVQAQQHWVYYTIPTRITTASMGAVAFSIARLRAQLAEVELNGQVLSALDQIIHGLQAQLALLELPLYVVAAQVIALALLFVAAMAGLLAEGQAAVIATLKSRGASGSQLLGAFAAQGLLVGAAAAVAGPWLASLLAVALVRAFVPAVTLAAAGATEPYLRRLADPRLAVWPAVAGALLGIAALLAAARRAARVDVVELRREEGRSTRVPFWRRAYLDVALALLCALGYVELGAFGGADIREQLGTGIPDPLVLAAPGLLLLAGALLLLRVFPFVVELGLRVAARTRGAVGTLAFAQVARSPAAPARLTLLLSLAVGVGLFALTFDGSLARNAADRAAYQTGADLRLTQLGPEPRVLDARFRERIAALPGVEGLTPVLRETAFDTGGENASADVLGIDPATWAEVAGVTSWRSNYAAAPLPKLMAALRAHQQGADDADRTGATGAGTSGHAIYALVSDAFAHSQGLRVGEGFSLQCAGGYTVCLFTVGAIVHDFPTLYAAHSALGFVVVDLYDYAGAVAVAGGSGEPEPGPDEYWLKTTDNAAARAALARALTAQAPSLDLAATLDRRDLQAVIGSNPVQTGMRGLLTLGAVIAAALGVLGTVTQSAVAARQRLARFAVLRTLGLAGGQLVRVLLGEQLVVYGFGLVAGTALGVILTTATLPFLTFSDVAADPTTIGVPPSVLAVDPARVGAFYLALLVAFAVALAVAALYAARVGLGRALRLGED